MLDGWSQPGHDKHGGVRAGASCLESGSADGQRCHSLRNLQHPAQALTHTVCPVKFPEKAVAE